MVQEGEEEHQGSFPQGTLACLGGSPGSHQKAQGLVREPQHAGCSSFSLLKSGRVCRGASIKRMVARALGCEPGRRQQAWQWKGLEAS